MKKQILIVLSFITTLSVVAQFNNNLVPNSSFEDIGKSKLKEPGSIFLAAPWRSITMNPVDLYSENTKNEDFGAPLNKYGEEKARTGKNYAGVNFFGYRGKIPRTYLGTQLESKLEQGKEYCLKFHLSMSDRSKYAVNNIGMMLLSEQMTEQSDGNIYKEPTLISVTNKVYDKQFSWTSICGTYTANGTEQFLVIGNFSKDEETKQETVRISKDIGGRQTNDGYYFIDDVSIISTENLKDGDCACEKIAGGRMKVEYKTFGENAAIKKDNKQKITIINSDGSKVGEKKPEAEVKKDEVLKDGVVYKKMTSEIEKVIEVAKEIEFSPNNVIIDYENKQFLFPETGKKQLNEIIDYLKKNSTQKIEITGHADASESTVKLIGKRRSALTRKALLDGGVSAARITYISQETKVKAKNGGTNSRVTFKVK